MSQGNDLDVGCFGLFCAGIAFFATWIFAFVTFNFLGLVLGWIPALIVAVVIYFTAGLAVWLIATFLFILCVLALLAFAGIISL